MHLGSFTKKEDGDDVESSEKGLQEVSRSALWHFARSFQLDYSPMLACQSLARAAGITETQLLLREPASTHSPSRFVPSRGHWARVAKPPSRSTPLHHAENLAAAEQQRRAS